VNSSLYCKQQGIWGPDRLHAWTYLNDNYSTFSTVSRYRVVIKVVFTSQHNWEHYQKSAETRKKNH